MGSLSLSNLPTSGGTRTAAQITNAFNATAAVINGNIDNTNVSASAAIAASKIDGLGAVKIDRKTGAAATYDFTGIAASWTDLRLTWRLATGSGNDFDSLRITLNGVAGTGYNLEFAYLSGPAPTLAGQEALSQSQWALAYIPGVTTGGWGVGELELPGYADTNGPAHACTVRFGAAANNATGKIRSGSAYGFALGVSGVAITRITLSPSAGSFVAGSHATLIGIP